MKLQEADDDAPRELARRYESDGLETDGDGEDDNDEVKEMEEETQIADLGGGWAMLKQNHLWC